MKSVIFDMDGVIFDTELVWKKALEDINKKYNLNLDDEYRKSICGKNELLIREELKQLFPNLDVNKYREEIYDYVNNEIKLGKYNIKNSFIDIIKYLKNKNYKIALATSSDKTRAINMFKNKNIDINIFDACIFAEDVGNKGKPNPYIFLCASNKLGCNPNECYVIEDSINGLQAAINGSFIPIMVIDLIEPNEYINNNVHYILNDLKEIEDIIK